MPTTTPDSRASRIRAAWRARACAASICVGAQTFALGAGLAMPMSLNAAYLSALSVLPASAIITLAAHAHFKRRTAVGKTAVSRAAHLLAALTLNACAVFAIAALENLAEQSLLPQAQSAFIVLCTLTLVALAAMGGGTGAARFAFALRLLLAAALPVLVLMTTSMNSLSGLFPLLGPGARRVLLAALGMTGGAAPALMLFNPPAEIDAILQPGEDVPLPGAAFFLWRMMLGAAIGCALLATLSLCSTYASIRGELAWGERMRVLCASHPQSGLAPAALVLCQTVALLLLAINTLCAAEQAFICAFPALGKRRLGLTLCVLLAAAALGAMVWFGFSAVPTAAGWLAAPGGLTVLLHIASSRKRIPAHTPHLKRM